jgi:hypothetical protein
MMYPLVRDLAADGVPVAVTCRVLKLARQPYYRWLAIDEKNSTRSSGSPQSGSESDALREANKRIKLLEQENEVLRRAAAYLSQANLPGK